MVFSSPFTGPYYIECNQKFRVAPRDAATKSIENFQEQPFVFYKHEQNTIEISKISSEYENTFTQAIPSPKLGERK